MQDPLNDSVHDTVHTPVPDPARNLEQDDTARDETVREDDTARDESARDDTAREEDPDRVFLDRVADLLAALPAVEAVTLGGSRAQGRDSPDSDWDLAVYYRGAFAPGDLRALTREQDWPGEVSEIGGWGGGVFNGGAWLTIDGRKVDVHYRDLDVVEHELAEARAGRFHHEPLMFHLAGIPSYLVVGELALNRVLRGALPRPEYPDALRRSAFDRWSGTARLTLLYAEANHGPRDLRTEAAGAVATAGMQAAHAVAAARGQWVTNEKTLRADTDLRGIDTAVAAVFSPDGPPKAITMAKDIFEKAFAESERLLLKQR